MPKLSEHQAGKFVKLMLIGDSGTGKTGALTSLVKDGYNLRILDMDNGLDALRQWVNHDCPDNVDQVDFETLRDTMRMTPSGPIVTAKSYIEALKLMSTWSDGTNPADATEKDIFVVDSLTALGKAALEWAKAGAPGAKDGRQWFSPPNSPSRTSSQCLPLRPSTPTSSSSPTSTGKKFRKGNTKGTHQPLVPLSARSSLVTSTPCFRRRSSDPARAQSGSSRLCPHR